MTSPRDPDFRDVAVVGAGMGGLVAACLLAAAGRSVTLVEAAGTAGGCCRTLRREGLSWDVSLYSLRGCRPGGPFPGLLRDLGVEGRLEFVHADSAYLVRTAAGPFELGRDRGGMRRLAEGIEPRGGERLDRLVERILGFDPRRDYGVLSRTTFAEAAAEAGVTGPLLEAFAAPLMISLGLPSGRASAWFAFLKYRLILEGGVSYPAGGPDRLVEVLCDRFRESGGETVFGEWVTRIGVEPGGRKRIETSAGRRLACDHVVINADASWALQALAGILPPAFGDRARKLVPGLSAHLLFLAVPRGVLGATGLDRCPHLLIPGKNGAGALWARLRAGRGEAGAAEGMIGLTSPAVWRGIPDGAAEVPVTAFVPASPAGSGPRGSGVAKAVMDRLRPVLGEASLADSLSPEELEERTGNRGGSFCGWEMGPERYGVHRLTQRLPVHGIFLAGHWTEPGPSVLNAALSGRNAARAILG